MSVKNVMQFVVRTLIMLAGFAACTFMIVVYKGENETGYAGPILGYLVSIVVPFSQRMEFHEKWHIYAKEKYNELLAIKDSCINENQVLWTKRLLSYLDGCSAPASKVSPIEIDNYIKLCVEEGKNNDFGNKNDILLDSYDELDTVLFYDELKSFAYGVA